MLETFLEKVHLAHFVAETLGWHMNPAAFLRDWGGLLGFAWLAGVIWWAAIRPEATKRARRLEWLKASVIDSIREFENLCKAYEEGPAGISPADNSPEARKAREASIRTRRLEFTLSMERVIRAALHLVPEDKRHEYKALLLLAMTEFGETHDDKMVIYAGDQSPSAAIWRALGMHEMKPTIPTPLPPAGPPDSTASGQSLPP